jgi:hypothetical protein
LNGTTRTRRGLRRVLGLSLGGAMIMAMAPGVASAQVPAPDARSTDDVCGPLSAYDRDRFDDTRGSAHERNVLCMESYGLTEGLRGGDSYGPRRDVNRGQMASFIARFIEDATGQTLQEGDGFRDVPDSYAHSDNINKIEQIGVTSGTRRSNGEEFDPLADVSRAQMASFISRALTYIEDGQGQPETVPPRTALDYFPDDDGSVHEKNINALADVGIVAGYKDGTYGWADSVKRDQMASFVMRAYDYLVEENVGGGDTTAPVVQTTAPAEGEANVPVATNVVATFDEALASGSTITLACNDVDIAGAPTIDGSTITFDPDADLPFDASCTATITARDAAGNESVTTVTFTTEAEAVAPALLEARVDTDMVDVNLDTATASVGDVWTLTFDDAVQAPDTATTFTVETDTESFDVVCGGAVTVDTPTVGATCELGGDGQSVQVELLEDVVDAQGNIVGYAELTVTGTNLVGANGKPVAVAAAGVTFR